MFLRKIAINTVGFMVIAALLPQFVVTNWGSALFAAIVLSILNVVVRPILMIAFIPLIAASFGVFMLIINALILWLMMGIVSGIHVTSFWMLIVVSVLLNIFRKFVENFFKEEEYYWDKKWLFMSSNKQLLWRVIFVLVIRSKESIRESIKIWYRISPRSAKMWYDRIE